MPIDNLGKNHFTATQIAAINDALEVLFENISGLSPSLTPKERSRYGKVGDQKVLLIDKVKDYRNTAASMSSPEVDWEEFFKDYDDRRQVGEMLSKLKTVQLMLADMKYLRDHDNYTDALRDYQYAQYKNRFGNITGYDKKIEDMQVFFPRTGKKAKKKDGTNGTK